MSRRFSVLVLSDTNQDIRERIGGLVRDPRGVLWDISIKGS